MTTEDLNNQAANPAPNSAPAANATPAGNPAPTPAPAPTSAEPAATNTPAPVTPTNINVGSEGLSADDLDRVNREIAQVRKDIKLDALEEEAKRKILEMEIRAKVLREMEEAKLKEQQEQAISQTQETVTSLKQQLADLKDQIANEANTQQQVKNKSPFDNREDIDNMSLEREKEIGRASMELFKRERSL